jgi:hypothetical protein
LEEWKIKVAVLWLVWIVSFVIHMMFLLFEPGGIEQISMQLTPELMLFAAILMLVPLVMAFLSLTLKDSINRLANVVLGIVYTGICLFDWIGSPVQPALHILMYISHIVASALIVWYAWNSKKLA